jgi:modified peptide precursor CbpA
MDNNIMNLKQPAKATPPISIRYVCDANGEQVGLSHYLMTEGRKAR